jgi:hypothetical protein
MSPTDGTDTTHVKVEVTALGDRRTVESLYLELRALAKQHGLQIEYQLKRAESDGPANS